MAFKGIFDPKQLAILTTTLDGFCRIGCIEKETAEHEQAGRIILSLYSRGATTVEALTAAMEDRLRREDPKSPFGVTPSGFQLSA